MQFDESALAGIVEEYWELKALRDGESSGVLVIYVPCDSDDPQAVAVAMTATQEQRIKQIEN